MARTTLRKVNQALKDAGFVDIELVAGNGYYWFSGGDSVLWHSQSVMTNHLTSRTPEEWVDEARLLRDGR